MQLFYNVTKEPEVDLDDEQRFCDYIGLCLIQKDIENNTIKLPHQYLNINSPNVHSLFGNNIFSTQGKSNSIINTYPLKLSLKPKQKIECFRWNAMLYRSPTGTPNVSPEIQSLKTKHTDVFNHLWKLVFSNLTLSSKYYSHPVQNHLIGKNRIHKI